MVSYVRFFQLPLVRPHYVKYLGRGHRYIPRYQQIMREEGVPEDTVFLAMIESGFANYATSRAKAVGPWQFIAPTGRLYGLQAGLLGRRAARSRRSRPAPPPASSRSSTRQTGDWRLAWAGYNAGLGTVQRAQARGYPDYWSMAAAKGRRALRAETKGYVPKLMAAAIIARHPEAFGFRPEEIEAGALARRRGGHHPRRGAAGPDRRGGRRRRGRADRPEPGAAPGHHAAAPLPAQAAGRLRRHLRRQLAGR